MSEIPPRRRLGRRPTQSVRVRERLLEMIAGGLLKPGQALPTEMSLAAAFNASQPTVNREIKRMLADGILACGSDGGRIVAQRRGGLLARTVLVCTNLADVETTRRAALDAWEVNLELETERRLVELGYLSWRAPIRRFSEREIDLLAGDVPCGAVIFADGMDPALAQTMRAAFATAQVGMVVHGSPEDHPGLDVVTSDHEAGGAAAASWLAARGCRRLVVQQDHSPAPLPGWLRARLAGNRRGAVEGGLAEPASLLQPPEIRGSLGERRLFDAEVLLMTEAIRPHLSGPLPLGILALSDGDVPRTWAAVRRLGLEPGRDILLAGYDGYWSDLLERKWEPTPPSVTVDKRHAVLGQQLAHTLDRRLREDVHAPPRHVLVAPVLRTDWT